MSKNGREKVGRLVKRLREQKGLDQYELADQIGVSQGTISNIESGKRKVQANVAITLAKFFDVDFHKFVSDE